ncbi:GNAT family N-acetyltransferase [Azospirillum sp. RWY-5-1]|uniref:GNAT family N-acetyltransferase n=1 Tax=Azospirillum oleiclasticum TaxID=2735135 RepID=A0ABX2T343_9PROT|nr:GNAT family N-acetyltransferase [Azospirillum oleiclasticum]NYZ11558.1 GNAT family N-acetyltransferase [Azospirillum oleiclasticum]NYZ18719.1 GNAT family N-acetyltransferase [Azospirillum oleiclasticum]
MTMGWRPMAAGDLDAVMGIAAVVHPSYPERREVFAERQALFPAGCLVAVADDAVVGYAVTHPAVTGEPPGLDTLLGALPAGADCLYLHDVAILPAVQGRRLGEAAFERIRAVAVGNGLAVLALIATPSARPYWLRHGFAPVAYDRDLEVKLATYGDGLAYMTRPSREIIPPE